LGNVLPSTRGLSFTRLEVQGDGYHPRPKQYVDGDGGGGGGGGGFL